MQDRLKTSQASFEIQPRVFYEDFKNIVLYVQDAIPTKGQALWRGIFLADISDPASPKITLAQRGALLSDGPNKLRFHLEDGTQQEIGPQGQGSVLDHDLRQYRDSARRCPATRASRTICCRWPS